MNRALTSFGLALLIAIQATAALAQSSANGPIETRLEARKVVRSPEGREAFVAAETVKPGDVIEYAVTYRNTSRDTVRHLEATLPIPAHTEFVPGSARRARASVDARDFADIPLKRAVVHDGRRVEETVPYRDYRFLRWYPGDLGPEMSVTFIARVKVLE